MTPAEERRYSALQDRGCCACLWLGKGGVPGDVHHIVLGSYRRLQCANRSTIVLCPYHHRGALPENYTTEQAVAVFGPSLATNKRAFYARFGTELELLEWS